MKPRRFARKLYSPVGITCHLCGCFAGETHQEGREWSWELEVDLQVSRMPTVHRWICDPCAMAIVACVAEHAPEETEPSPP
jgi:hypothetical protein